MEPYQTGDIIRLLNDTLEECRRRGYSEASSVIVAEMKVIELIRAWIKDGDFDDADDPQTA